MSRCCFTSSFPSLIQHSIWKESPTSKSAAFAKIRARPSRAICLSRELGNAPKERNSSVRPCSAARQRWSTARKIPDCPVPQIVMDDPGAIVSAIAHIFYGRPSRKIRVVGITGTNGKTTTAYLVRHILNKIDHRCGMIGTVETDDGKLCREATLTTPGAIEVVKLLGGDARQRLPRLRDGGLQPCAGSGPRGGSSFRRGRVHQSDAGSSRLSPGYGSIRRGQGEAF